MVPDEFVKALLSNSIVISEKKTERHSKLLEIAGLGVWAANMHRSNEKTIVQEGANLFNPRLTEGRDFELWLPEGKPRKRG